MSRLTQNPLQEVNLPAKPYVHNGAQDRYWVLKGLGVSHWKKRQCNKQLFVLILGRKKISDTIPANQKRTQKI